MQLTVQLASSDHSVVFTCVSRMSLPLVRLASLDLLRGFVAVGRRLSITLAAQDLCLTQSAVSRQVQALEAQVGVPLLLRGHRSVAFTPQGERLFRTADTALQQLQEVLGELRQGPALPTVTITASIGVASLWLLPQLGGFQAAHPGLEVRVAANDRVLDLQRERVDLAIRYSTRPPDGAVRLFGETVVPVASPSLAPPGMPLAQLLREQVLLEFEQPQRPWLQWADRLAAAGVSPAQTRGMLRFNQYDQVIHAALAGHGIALGRLPLVGSMVDAGRLVTLGDTPDRHDEAPAYWLLQAEPQPRAEVATLADWLVAAAAQSV